MNFVSLVALVFLTVLVGIGKTIARGWRNLECWAYYGGDKAAQDKDRWKGDWNA